MTRPITPDEVVALKQENMPDKVIEAFNAFIAEKWDGSSAYISQNEAARKIARFLDISESQVYSRHYLDVEDIFRKAGWHVEYDHKGYNEEGEDSFTFRKR